MGLLGLRFAIICLLLSGCLFRKVDDPTYTYFKYKIGNQAAIDSIKVVIKDNKYSIKEPKERVSEPFWLYEKKGLLYFLSISCDVETEIILQKGFELDNKCEPIIPFVGERITILDKKAFTIKNKKHEVFKIYNEIGTSPLDNFTIYWLNGKGIILIKLQKGEYFELKECDHLILDLIKKDVKFSELWPKPPTPSLPVFEKGDK